MSKTKSGLEMAAEKRLAELTEVKDYDQMLISMDELKGKMFDALYDQVMNDRLKELPEEDILSNLANGLYFYSRVIQFVGGEC